MDMSVQRPKKVKNFSFKKLLKNGMLLFLFAYVVYTFASQQITLSRCSRVAKDYEDKIAEEKLTEQRLREEYKNTEKDEYLERMAREKLGLVKANERVYEDVTKK